MATTEWVHINRVGIELEGGWNTQPRGFKHDGSVSVRACAYPGEVASNPLTKTEWESWVTATHPDVANASCGLHVHMSFKTMYAMQRIMDKPFQTYLLDQLKRWGERHGVSQSHALWTRLNGGNRYCLKSWKPDASINRTESVDRYHQVNFTAYHEHGTVEFRLLPMFNDPEMTVAAVKKLIGIVERWLIIDAPNDRPILLTMADLDQAGDRADLVTAEVKVIPPAVRRKRVVPAPPERLPFPTPTRPDLVLSAPTFRERVQEAV